MIHAVRLQLLDFTLEHFNLCIETVKLTKDPIQKNAGTGSNHHPEHDMEKHTLPLIEY
jgi:hypothetical protein